VRTPSLRPAVGVGVLLFLAALPLAGCTARTSGAAGSPGATEPAIQAVAGLFGQDGSAPRADAPQADRQTPPIPQQPSQPCAGNDQAQFIRVSISDQHAWLCARERLVYDTAVTTGMTRSKDTRTPTGSYRIQSRNTDTTLDPGTGEAFPVKYWIPFDAPAFGFHDSAWQKFPYGSERYHTQGSHGCVHMPLVAMKFLYDWVRVGATVHIVA
jgi:lipoprotein-anchoring transpeptidase ErfK/SrfK